MRPLTLILLIIVVGVFAFFGFTIYQSKKVNAPSSSTSGTVSKKQLFKLKVNSKSIWLNGNETMMDTPVREIDGRTMVPLKFLLDFFKAENIKYDEKTEEITFDLDTKNNIGNPINTNRITEPIVSLQEEDKLLSKEKREKIFSTASMSATYFKVDSIESDGYTIMVKIDLLMEPKSIEEVKKITDLFTNDVSFIFDEKHNIKVTAFRTQSNNKIYGTSKFSADSGKIDFSEQVIK